MSVPGACPETRRDRMSYHFRVGEFVRLDLTPNRSAEKVFEVVRLLPVSEDGECQYQVISIRLEASRRSSRAWRGKASLRGRRPARLHRWREHDAFGIGLCWRTASMAGADERGRPRMRIGGHLSHADCDCSFTQ